MYGMDIDTLNVYVSYNSQMGKPVWTRSRNQGLLFQKKIFYVIFHVSLNIGNQWLRGQYSVIPPSDNSSYQFVFEGIVGQ